jgi:hypothetical protein
MLRVCLVCSALAAVALGQQIPVIPYDSLMSDLVSVDGYVDREDGEYPAEFPVKAAGLTVSWGFDNELIYLALETKGKGWMAIGFGAPGMDESNMLFAYNTDDSAGMYNLVGSGFTHKVVGDGDSLDLDWDIDFDDETGVTTFEVAYPLTWRGDSLAGPFGKNPVLAATAIPGLVPGDVFDVVLAQNTKSVSLGAKHTHRTKFKVQLAARPERTPEPDSGR